MKIKKDNTFVLLNIQNILTSATNCKILKDSKSELNLGITPGAYSKIERGESDPNTMRLQEIAKALKVSIGELFDDKSVAFDNPNAYGFATKDEVQDLNKIVHALALEIKKLREEIQSAQPKKLKSKKVSKK